MQYMHFCVSTILYLSRFVSLEFEFEFLFNQSLNTFKLKKWENLKMQVMRNIISICMRNRENIRMHALINAGRERK